MQEEPERLTILVVDDCSKTLAILEKFLQDEFRFLAATSGRTGIETAARERPDVVLLSIALPDVDGFRICQRLKASQQTRHVPIIFMSEAVSDEQHDRAFRVGGADFLHKPLRRNEALSRIRNQIRLQTHERRIRRQAMYDELTNLPSRVLSFDRLRNAIAQDKRKQLKTAVLFIDLDNFKTINDSLGHKAGDQLLTKAALRFQEHVRRGDTVGRLAGDEFIMVLSGLQSNDDAKTVAESLLRAFETPFKLADVTQTVGISIGAAVAPDDSSNASKLLACADFAMYQAKRQGRACFKFYSATMNVDVARRRLLESNLHSAMDEDEMYLHYQPITDIHRDDIVGVEALLRWASPALGAVSPAEFVRQAEHSGLIWDIGEFVLRQSCADILELRNREGEPLRLSVNISPQQLRRAEFPLLIERILTETGFPAARLEIDITEELLMNRGGMISYNLQRLSGMGVRLALDDFGTGLSALSYLGQYRFDTLKIDHKLIEGMVNNPEHDAMVSAAIAIGQAFHLNTVAEGLETESQLAGLRNKQCRLAQGNFLSPPVPLEKLVRDVLTAPRPLRQPPQLHLVPPANPPKDGKRGPRRK